MSIGWMVFVAGLIALEKLLPWKAAANRGIAAGLAVLGLAVAFFPDDVPGLTIPGSPEANRAMMRMDGQGGAMGGMKKKAGGMGTRKSDTMGGKSGGMH
jgi:hypothetical protein